MNLSGGWQASWDSALDPYLDLNDHGLTNGDTALVIEKTAQFINGPVAGIFPSIDITFTQISPTAVANIIIQDEIITNLTGTAWTDFHMDLLGSPNVSFNPGLSAGFSVSPFTSSSFTNSNTTFNAFGGVVAHGATWQPGVGPGSLWINITGISPTSEISFVLSERPTPAPSAIAVLTLAGLAGTRRRRA